MKLTRLLSLATALTLAAMLTVPTGALAHEVVETMVRFNGNYLMVDVGATTDPVDRVRLDIYQGKIGRTKGSTLVTAGAYSFDWEPIPGSNTCRVETIEWIGQSGDSPSAPYVTDVEFTSPHSGVLQVGLEMHGQRRIYEGLLSSNEIDTWCDRQPEPISVTDLGEADFYVAASWDSEVVLKGKRVVRIRTSVAFESAIFDGAVLSLDGEQIAVSWERKMPIPVYEFVG